MSIKILIKTFISFAFLMRFEMLLIVGQTIFCTIKIIRPTGRELYWCNIQFSVSIYITLPKNYCRIVGQLF